MGLWVHEGLGDVHLTVIGLVRVRHRDAAAHVVAPGLVEPEVKHVGEEEILLLLFSFSPAQLKQGRRNHLDLKSCQNMKYCRVY